MYGSDYTYYTDINKIRNLLVGKKIVAAEKTDEMRAVFTLLDGTEIVAHGNEGCGGCGEGWYEIQHVGFSRRVIKDVEVEYDDYETNFNLNVIYGNKKKETIFTVSGTDNGYYGVGFSLYVKE